MADDEDNPFVKIRTYPCDLCGRQFKQDSLMKHRNVCQNITKPRKIFDSGRQRASGSDVNYTKTRETRKVQIEGEKPIEDQSRGSNWRQKHNEFIRSIRQARGVTEALRTGAPLPKFEPSAVPSDYVNCQYCGRNFNRNAAERHIPFCETQSKRQKINNSASKTQVVRQKAPLPGQRKQSSEPYGNNYNPNEYSSAKAYQSGSTGSMGRGGGGGGGGGGYISGNSSGNGRRPIKYDSQQYYYDSDNVDSGVGSAGAGGAYSNKNKNLLANKANSRPNEQILRTGRNVTNSELNALARNRSGNSQKDSPKNSRDPSINRRGGPGIPVSQQNGLRGGAGGGGGYSKQSQGQPQYQHEGPSGAKFCHECGSEFPVQWARFCSFCGSGRV